MGFPHVGTVDTRHNDPGTIKAQLSFGAGTMGIVAPNTLGLGTALSLDSYVSPRLSIATSGHLLSGTIRIPAVFGSARAGLRFRPNQRLSLGFGAFGGASRTWTGHEHSLFYGGDLELATSRVRPKERFASHAWRLSLGHSPTEKQFSRTLLGDWSRSRPTRNKNLRFSYGLNYGISLHSSTDQMEEDFSDRSVGFTFFGGFHVGMQWGGKWGEK